MPLAQRGGALADERHRDAILAAQGEPHRQARHVQRGNAQRGGSGQDAPRQVADVEVLAVHRAAGLAHLGVQDHAHGLGRRAHGQGDTGVPDQRRRDVALPRSVGCAKLRSAPQP